jgi:hypothetical protein
MQRMRSCSSWVACLRFIIISGRSSGSQQQRAMAMPAALFTGCRGAAIDQVCMAGGAENEDLSQSQLRLGGVCSSSPALASQLVSQ